MRITNKNSIKAYYLSRINFDVAVTYRFSYIPFIYESSTEIWQTILIPLTDRQSFSKVAHGSSKICCGVRGIVRGRDEFEKIQSSKDDAVLPDDDAVRSRKQYRGHAVSSDSIACRKEHHEQGRTKPWGRY